MVSVSGRRTDYTDIGVCTFLVRFAGRTSACFEMGAPWQIARLAAAQFGAFDCREVKQTVDKQRVFNAASIYWQSLAFGRPELTPHKTSLPLCNFDFCERRKE